MKVAELQDRGAVHFHAIIRLDAPPDDHDDNPRPPLPECTVELLARAVRAAVPKVAAKSPSGPSGRTYTARWGSQLDLQPLRTEGRTAEAVAGYVAKYATKEPEAFEALNRRITCEGDIEALDVREHIRRLVVTAWELGGQEELTALNLRLWAHQLGFRGHWLTKSRHYSTTFTALRQARRDHRQRREADQHEVLGQEQQGVEQAGHWVFVGAGYRNHADAWLVDTARRRRELGREVLREERARARAA